MTVQRAPRIARTPEVEAWLRKHLAHPAAQGPIPERARRALAGVLGDDRSTSSPAGPRDVPGQPSRLRDRTVGGTDADMGERSVPSSRGGGTSPAAAPGLEPAHPTYTPKAGVA